MKETAQRARAASRILMRSSDAARVRGLTCMAKALRDAWPTIQEANAADLAAGAGLDAAVLQRLKLDKDKLDATLTGVDQIAAMPDPIGRTLRSTQLVDGPALWQVTAPLGVICTIFESRPDVCIQIPALTIRSGNAVILKGGSEAARSNQALIDAIRAGLQAADLPADAVQLVTSREDVAGLLGMHDDIDLIVPRGSNQLVKHIQENTRIPVMGHAAGICHIYVDKAADLDKATRIIHDAKLDYPSACNAVETVLVHQDLIDWSRDLHTGLESAGAKVRTDDANPDMEYGVPELNLIVVEGLDAALDHIARHGSGHTECILTEDDVAKAHFLAGVDAAGVYVNASTRFADGQRYGLGAEVGISTNKFHARGPVGVEGLMTTRWILVGDGDTVGGHGAWEHAPGGDPPWSGWQ